jgi:hypothetical protein
MQISHDRWQFPPPSTVGAYLILDMLVISMSSSFWTVEIGIRDFDNKLFIGEQYIINF